MSSAATGAPARWNWYVHVADIDAALAMTGARGGMVLRGPDPIPGGRFSAHIADPAGTRLGLAGPRPSAQDTARCRDSAPSTIGALRHRGH